MLKPISIFETFAVSSMIIPYYAPPHLSFLLLSQLNSKSRAMLDEFYEEVMNCMLSTAICVSISEENEKMLLLPCNLFKFSIDLKHENILKIFLHSIEEIKQKNGYYFNKHFMHSRLCIIDLYVDSSLITKLYTSIDLLKEVEVISDISRSNTSFSYQRTKLINQFSLNLKQYSSITTNKIDFPHFGDKDSDKTKLKIEFLLFKRIYYANLSYMPIDRSINILEEIRDLELQFDKLCISSKNSEESDLITSPEFYNKGVGSLSYCFQEPHAL